MSENTSISRAKLRYIRVSPQKARLVADIVRGKDVDEALRLLKFTRKKSAPIIGKLISSALANATVKDPSVDVDELFVKFGAQRQRGQALRFATCEDGRPVAAWQVINLGPNGTNLCGLATIETKAFIQDQIADGLLLG